MVYDSMYTSTGEKITSMHDGSRRADIDSELSDVQTQAGEVTGVLHWHLPLLSTLDMYQASSSSTNNTEMKSLGSVVFI